MSECPISANPVRIIPFDLGRTLSATYSACTDEVLRLLLENNISEAYISGIDTDCCVLATAISLFEHNIRPIVLTHYCASNGGALSHQAAITVLERTIGLKQICSEPYYNN